MKTTSRVKSSIQRGITNDLVEQYPALAEHMELVIPKKDPLTVCKCVDHVQLVVGEQGEPTFFQCRQGPFIPTLRLLHRFPDILPKYQVDRGAIRFVLSGANIMAPGLTSAGGCMAEVEEGAVVAITAEGKEHALAIGVTTMSTADIRSQNKGIAVETTHYLKDDLWSFRAAV